MPQRVGRGDSPKKPNHHTRSLTVSLGRGPCPYLPGLRPHDVPRVMTRGMAKRQRTTSSIDDRRARWLLLEDFTALVSAASSPTWTGKVSDTATTATVVWQSVSSGPNWEHELVWVPCPTGSVAIHRFTPQASAKTAEELEQLRGIAMDEMAAAMAADGSDSASNVGGYHGERDLWSRPALHELSVPWLISSALQQAAAAEASALERAPIPTRPDECWFNALNPGGWNVLHTHSGSTYSATLFVADGGCCDGPDRLAGRLAFVPSAPTRARREEQSAHTLAGRALDAEGKHACCLLVDPTPGTLVVFPSFVPHFVLPTPVAAEPCTARPLRLSIAMNFGACDPVLAHVLVVPSRTGTPRVKLALEVDDAFR